MDIIMIGMDYKRAAIELREKLSLSMKDKERIASLLIKQYELSGCNLLCTCNRTEIWISTSTKFSKEDLIDYFLNQLVSDDEKLLLSDCFIMRTGEEAIMYLMELGCGLHSQIFGEDQILAQLKTSLEESREFGSVDAVLETLFRTAITAAKKVKTKVHLTNQDTSLPQTVVHTLENEYGSLKNKKCMVIGNGEMGRIMASELVKKGCIVDMTIRQYKKKEVVIPKGCGVILYEERYHHMKEQDYIFSATKSPHYTITREHYLEMLIESGIKPVEVNTLETKKILVDLAVPRDIDPEIETIPFIKLYPMDAFDGDAACSQEVLEEARNILHDYKQNFINWCEMRCWAPVVNEISEIASTQTQARLTKVYKTLGISGETKELLQEGIQHAVEKTFAKLMFGIKDKMNPDDQKELLKLLDQEMDQLRQELMIV